MLSIAHFLLNNLIAFCFIFKFCRSRAVFRVAIKPEISKFRNKKPENLTKTTTKPVTLSNFYL